MVNIQSNILDKLHCSQCNGYLSYAPIMIKEDGGNLCGRCINDNSGVKLIRNQVYEDLAAVAAFPCRYKELGCELAIPWQDIVVHEDHCEYRPTDCPVTPQGTCKWKGPQLTLLDHYKEVHPELILEHPCSLDADIVVDNDKNMLLSLMGFVFLVQIRCNTALSKLWHCVHCFAQPQVAEQFNFCVEFMNDDAGFKKRKPVLAEKNLTMQIDKSVETNVNMLLEFIGDCNNIKVILSILPKVDSNLLNVLLCSECKNPAFPAIFRIHDNYYCVNCKSEITPDRNKEYLYKKLLKKCKYNAEAGCPYIHINKKLVYRHEIWECKWQKKCVLNCDINYDELQNHFVEKRHNSILRKNLTLDCWHYGQIKKNDNIFLCKCFINNTCTKIYIYSQLPIQDIHLYKCEIKGNQDFGPKNFTLTYTPTAEHDWEINKTYLDNRNPFLCTLSQNYICDIIISK